MGKAKIIWFSCENPIILRGQAFGFFPSYHGFNCNYCVFAVNRQSNYFYKTPLFISIKMILRFWNLERKIWDVSDELRIFSARFHCLLDLWPVPSEFVKQFNDWHRLTFLSQAVGFSVRPLRVANISKEIIHTFCDFLNLTI